MRRTHLNPDGTKSMNARGDDNDFEALASRAHELTDHYDMSKFTIDEDGHDDDDNELEGDYDSITTYDADDIPDEYAEGGDNATLTPGNEFALAERTSSRSASAIS